jgi:aspartyl-tRNA(Asn)/glutamyl-tRNA(Gln) amidotransferase subunit A
VKDPAKLTLTEIAGALRRRAFSSTELTRWMLERIGRWQPIINAFVRIDEDEALAAAKRADRALGRGKAKGALHGVPLAHKDMYYVKGKVSECGSKVRKGWIAPATATVLTRLAAAGSFPIGALHMSEFAYSPTGHNSYLGPACNAWDAKCITGGSSSGSGTAVAARLIPAALGSDTGGSIRLPAPFLRRDRVQADLWTRQPRQRAAAIVHARYRRPAGGERGGCRGDHGHHRRA